MSTVECRRVVMQLLCVRALDDVRSIHIGIAHEGHDADRRANGAEGSRGPGCPAVVAHPPKG
jgi:hypothetical protein